MNLLDLYGNNDPYGISSMYDGSGGGGGGGGGYDAAPPLTLQDLWSPTAMPQYPQAPTLPNQWTDLGPQDQQQIAKRSLMLMTARALAQPGQLGSGLLQGALAAQQMQGGAVDQARQDAMREYAMARQNAEQNALATRAQNMDTMRQREAQAALGVYNRIVQNAKASGADPDTYNQIESQARA